MAIDYVKLEEEKPIKKKSRKLNFKNILIIAILLFLISSFIGSITYSMSPKIAVVPINGVIMTQSETSILSQSSLSSREIATTLLSFKDDSSIKAVLIDINSGGGSPVASEEISNAIIELRNNNITVYSLINDVGASGAFWIAVSTDKIFASSMSTLGSIGVTSAGLSFENFIKNYNITYRKQTAGEYKDMGSIFREPTKQEEEKLQIILNEVHENFIYHVANNRNLSYDYVKEFATGEIFLGSFAKDKGFIDEIGYYPDVIKELKDIVGKDVLIVNYGPKTGLFENLRISNNFQELGTENSQILLK